MYLFSNLAFSATLSFFGFHAFRYYLQYYLGTYIFDFAIVTNSNWIQKYM